MFYIFTTSIISAAGSVIGAIVPLLAASYIFYRLKLPGIKKYIADSESGISKKRANFLIQEDIVIQKLAQVADDNPIKLDIQLELFKISWDIERNEIELSRIKQFNYLTYLLGIFNKNYPLRIINKSSDNN